MEPFGTSKHLSTLLRLYIYSLHGYFIEVTFTAIYDFWNMRDWKLAGNSSLWSLIIYGTCGLAIEKLSYFLRRKEVPMSVRSFIYLLSIYSWEFTSGYILRYFKACPWDYSAYRYNIGGLITLEYAPLWLIAGLVAERVIMGRLEYIRWSDDLKVNGVSRASRATKANKAK